MQKITAKNLIKIALTAMFMLIVSAVSISASTITVTNTNDSGAGSLRDALIQTGTNNQPDTIVFDPTVFNVPLIITLTSGELVVPADSLTTTGQMVTITGTGANLLTISGNNTSRVLYLDRYAQSSISGLTVSGGLSTGTTNPTFNGNGGGIYVHNGVLNLNDVVLNNNVSTFNSNESGGGGGVYYNNAQSSATLNSTFTNNSGGSSAMCFCGSQSLAVNHVIANSIFSSNSGFVTVSTRSGATATISNTLVEDNTGTGIGGNSGLTLENVTIRGNTSYGLAGSEISLKNSTINNNGDRGVSLNSSSSPSVIMNSTISNNAGIGVSVFSTSVNIDSSTITLNRSSGLVCGGGCNFRNSIFYGNTSFNSPSDIADLVGNGQTAVSQGYNIIGTVGIGMVIPAMGDQFNVNPLLAPLADNGGTTQTHALTANSPAIDTANPANFPSTDQRGVNRPLDGDNNGSFLPDIGSFEAPGASLPNRALFDFDGDGRSDISLFRPDAIDEDNNYWKVLQSSDNQITNFEWGIATDADSLAPADYDGDGTTDYAIWRESEGNFYIFNSSDNSIRIENFGLQGDILTVGDWDNDGKADLSVYREGSQSVFYVRGSNNNPNSDISFMPWGTTGDKPMRGDFDGDGIQDAAVFRTSNAVWYILQSSNNSVRFDNWGLSTDTFVPADYDGDSKTDLAVFRDGVWYILHSTNNQARFEYFGIAGDTLVPADYDGDGNTDIAIMRNSIWYIQQSSNSNITFTNFGLSGDKPIPNAYVNQ